MHLQNLLHHKRIRKLNLQKLTGCSVAAFAPFISVKPFPSTSDFFIFVEITTTSQDSAKEISFFVVVTSLLQRGFDIDLFLASNCSLTFLQDVVRLLCSLTTLLSLLLPRRIQCSNICSLWKIDSSN